MSSFVKLLRWLLGGEDEEHDGGSTNTSSPKPPASSSKPPSYYPYYSTNTSSSSPKPPASSSKPPPYYSTNTSSSSPKPPASPKSTSVNPSSSSPKPPASSSKPPPYYSTNTSSSSPKPPTSSSKPPESTFVNPSSSSPKPPASSSKPPPSSSTNTSSFTLKFPPSVSIFQQSSADPHSTFPKPPTSSSKLPQSTVVSPSSSSFQPRPSSYSPPHSSSNPSPSSPTPSAGSSLFSPKLSTSSSKAPQASSKPHPPSSKPITSSSKPSPSSPIGTPFPSSQPSFPIGPPFPSSQPGTSPAVPHILKSVLSPASSNAINEKGKKHYKLVETDPLPIFVIPEDIKDLIKNDIAPRVLNQPLSPTTYKDYFAALLFAEEFYHEKWPHFDLENKTLELHEAEIHKNPENEEKTFVKLEIDTSPENRPFLLSRDLVFVRPAGTNVEHFQGFIYRIVRSSLVLVEFEDDFYVHHDSTQKYDVSFSFNRVCLKRAHQAVQTASDALFQNFLFPECVSRTSIPTAPPLLSTRFKLDPNQLAAVRHILSIQGSPPYLVAGRNTRVVVSEAVSQLCQTSLENRILICAPSNRCCDDVMRSLLKVIPESDMFRANAAFREIDEVPEDILRSCLYEDPYFSCPPTEKLGKFRVIFSTFMSSFRLHDKGLTAGHFSHIFLVDASSAIEPETAVTLTNFADQDTTVIVTGEPGDRSRWVRADMARHKGLTVSYFERLFKSRPYRSLNPLLITRLDM